MKKIIYGLTAIGVLALAAVAPAAVTQQGKNFDTDPIWAGNGNRTAPNDFGYSATNNAGGVAAGEIGGFNERTPKAFYGNSNLGTIDWANDEIYVSFKVMLDGPGNPSVGYFNAASYLSAGDVRASEHFGFRIDDNAIYAVVGTPSGGSQGTGLTLTYGTPSTVIMTYSGATNMFTLKVDSQTTYQQEVDLAGATFDHFGITTFGDSEGHGNNLWIDDLNYSVGSDVATEPTPTPTPEPTPTPTPPPIAAPVNGTWVEMFNRDSGAEIFNTDVPLNESLVVMTSGPSMSDLGWGGYYPPGVSAARRTRVDTGANTSWLPNDAEVSTHLSMTDSDHSAGAYAYAILPIPIDLTVPSAKIEFDAIRSVEGTQTDLKIILKTEANGWIISGDLTFFLPSAFQGTVGGVPAVVINLPAGITSWFPITNATATPRPDLDGADDGLTNDTDALQIGATAITGVDLSVVSAFGIYLNSSLADNNEFGADGFRLTGAIDLPNRATTWTIFDN